MLSDFVAAGQIVEIQAVNPMPEEGAEGKQEETGDSGESIPDEGFRCAFRGSAGDHDAYRKGKSGTSAGGRGV